MNVRARGFLKVLGSGLVFAVIVETVFKNGLGDPAIGGPFRMIAMGVPGAFALAGLIELVTGIEFQRIASAWDDLAGWQRGVLGILVVILAFVIMMACVVAFA